MKEIKDIPKTILIGGGGHAVSLLENFRNEIAGYLALAPSNKLLLKWYGNDDYAANLIKDGFRFHVAYVYSGEPDMQARKKIIGFYEKNNAPFSTFISPSAFISPNSSVEEGSVVMPGAILNRATVMRHVVVNTGAILEHDSIIGNNSFIGPGAILGGFVNIGDDCFIGLGAKIRNGVKISSGVTIGMGSVVTKNVDKPGVYYGII